MSVVSRMKSTYKGLPDIDYPFHDRIIVVTNCGRICLGHKEINFSTVFAGQAVGIKEVHDDILRELLSDRAVVVTVTVNGATALPLREIEVGTTEHVAAAGAPEPLVA